MRKEEPTATNIFHLDTVHHSYAYLVTQIVEQPDIVVAYEPVYLDTGIGKLRKRTEKPHMPLGTTVRYSYQ